jgi:hypothetical protein
MFRFPGRFNGRIGRFLQVLMLGMSNYVKSNYSF